MSLEGPKIGGSASPDPLFEIWDFIKNRFVVKLVFKAEKISKTAPKGINETQKTIQEFLKNDFHEKSFFAILSMRKR